MVAFAVVIAVATAAHGAGAHRHVGQPRKHAFFGQQRIQLLGQTLAVDHHPSIENPIEQQPCAMVQLHAFGGMADRAAQRLRAERNPLAVERGRSGEHAEALSQQVQHQIRARLLARGDRMQHRALVHHRLVDETEIAEVHHRNGGRSRSRRCREHDRLADAGQPGFHHLHEARHQIVTVQTHDAQGMHVVGGAAGGADAVGKTEQFLLEFGHRSGEIALQILAEQRKRTLKRAAHAPWQPCRGQGPWRGGVLGVGGRSHLSLSKCDDSRIS